MEVSSYLPVPPAAPAAGFVFQCTWPSAAVKAWRGEWRKSTCQRPRPHNLSMFLEAMYVTGKKTTTIRNCVCFRGFDCRWYAVWTSNISGMTTMSFLPRAYSLYPGLILRLDSTAFLRLVLPSSCCRCMLGWIAQTSLQWMELGLLHRLAGVAAQLWTSTFSAKFEDEIYGTFLWINQRM